MTGLRSRTLTAVLPQAQVHARNGGTARVACRVDCSEEHVGLDSVDGVSIVAQDASQADLLDLNQLLRLEHRRVLVPEPDGDRQQLRWRIRVGDSLARHAESA